MDSSRPIKTSVGLLGEAAADMSSSGSKPQEETVPTVEIEVECADVDEPGDVAVEILPEVDELPADQEDSSGGRTGGRGRRTEPQPETLQWLEENYELAEGVCLPRNAIYAHYLGFCESEDHVPVNAASFGKIMRHKFPALTTRRLGTRGQSKYHYYGIGVKESSSYFGTVQPYNKSSGTPASEACNKDPGNKGNSAACSPGSKVGALLPPFPKAKELILTKDIADKVETFIMMYRAHCQRILDSVVRASVDDVRFL